MENIQAGPMHFTHKHAMRLVVLLLMITAHVVAEQSAPTKGAPPPKAVVVDLHTGDKVISIAAPREATVAWFNYVMATRSELIIQAEGAWDFVEPLIQLHRQRPDAAVTVLANRETLAKDDLGRRLLQIGAKVFFRTPYAKQSGFQEMPPLRGFLAIRDRGVLWMSAGAPPGHAWANIFEVEPLAEQYRAWLMNLQSDLPSLANARTLFELGGN